MKRLYTLLLAVIISTGFFHANVSANHIAALDLNLISIGGNDYIVRFALYRDCSGIIAPNTVNFIFTCQSDPFLGFALNNVPLKSGSGGEVTPGCFAMPTRCQGSQYTLFGVQEYIYEAQVTLPPCSEWKVSWTYCCRTSLNNISNPTSTSAYIEATLNTLDVPVNSNPVYTNKPIFILINGQPQCISAGAIDPDGDSLSYSLVAPFNNHSSNVVNYVPPYSATSPIPSNPPVTLDNVTGDICITPVMNFASQIALKIEQWKNVNGVPLLTGIVYRDMMVRVITVPNILPVLSGMDFTKSQGYDPNNTLFEKVVCLGDTVAFAIWGHDDDIYNPLAIGSPEKFSINWNHGIPSGTFQTYHQNTDSAYATFTWIPDTSNVSGTPHCYRATIRDGACPYYGSNIYEYCLTVKSLTVDIGPDTLLCKGESVTFNAITSPNTINHFWKLNGLPTGHPPNSHSLTLNSQNLKTGVHTVSLETNDGIIPTECPGYDEATVTVVYLPAPDLGNDTVIYGNTPLLLDAGPGELYYWSTGATSQTIFVNSTGVYNVIVDGGYHTRCTGTDWIFVEFIIGIEDVAGKPNLLLSPNPAGNILKVTVSEPITGSLIINLYNDEGRSVHRETLTEGLNENLPHTVNLGHLQNGLYLLNFVSDDMNLTRKVMITR